MRLLPFTPPEILEADLAPLALELAAWGVNDAGAARRGSTPPPARRWRTARELLRAVSARSTLRLRSGQCSARSRRTAEPWSALGLHPRLAHLMLKGRELKQGRVAALIAALLGERDFLRERDVDLRHRVDIALSGRGAAADPGGGPRGSRAREARDETPDAAMTGALLALAYPDRIGRRRAATGTATSCPAGAARCCPRAIRCRNEEFLVVAETGRRIGGRAHLPRGGDRRGRDRGAFTRTGSSTSRSCSGTHATTAVLARRRRRLGALLIEDKPLVKPDPAKVKGAMLDGHPPARPALER